MLRKEVAVGSVGSNSSDGIMVDLGNVYSLGAMGESSDFIKVGKSGDVDGLGVILGDDDGEHGDSKYEGYEKCMSLV